MCSGSCLTTFDFCVAFGIIGNRLKKFSVFGFTWSFLPTGYSFLVPFAALFSPQQFLARFCCSPVSLGDLFQFYYFIFLCLLLLYVLVIVIIIMLPNKPLLNSVA